MATYARDEPPSVLVVEDEFIIALDLSETVRDLGYRVDGPYVSRANALDAIAHGFPDLAILDVFTADGEVYPLADILTDAGVPIIFHSGHACTSDMHVRYPNAQAVGKPCPPDQLIGMVQVVLDPPGHSRD